MFYQIFLSPQVKQCAIITYKHGIWNLPHELLNDLTIHSGKNLCTAEFSTKIDWNLRLAAPDAPHTLTHTQLSHPNSATADARKMRPIE